MIAWFVRAGTAVFGDTPFGARAGGLLALAGTQLLLADIVRRRTHGLAPMLLALLAPEAAVYYGLMMVLVAPDVPLVVGTGGAAVVSARSGGNREGGLGRLPEQGRRAHLADDSGGGAVRVFPLALRLDADQRYLADGAVAARVRRDRADAR
jgi:hypothetical protein